MASFNSCTFSGRAGRDAETRYLTSGKAVTKFRLAVDRYGKKGDPKPDPMWLQVEVWGGRAQVAADYIKKGTQIIVQGELGMDVWTDKDGKERTSPTLNCSNFTLLGGDREKTSGYTGDKRQPDPEEEEVPF